MGLDEADGIKSINATGERVRDIAAIDQFGHAAQQGVLSGNRACGEDRRVYISSQWIEIDLALNGPISSAAGSSISANLPSGSMAAAI